MFPGRNGQCGRRPSFPGPQSLRPVSNASTSTRSSRSFSTSSSQAQSRINSPSLDSVQFPDDFFTPGMPGMPSPLGSGMDFQNFQPTSAGSFSHQDVVVQGLSHRVDSLSHAVFVLRDNLKETNGKLDTILGAIKGMGSNPNHAPWIYEAYSAYQQLPRIAEGSNELADLQQRYPSITTWLPGSEKSSIAPMERVQMPGGRRDMSKGINKTARYIEDGNGTVVDGWEYGRLTTYLRSLLVDVRAAGLLAARFSELGHHVKAALIYKMEQEFPYLSLCTDHWKAVALLKSRYRHWAGYRGGGGDDNEDGDGDGDGDGNGDGDGDEGPTIATGAKRLSTGKASNRTRKRRRTRTDPATDPALIQTSEPEGDHTGAPPPQTSPPPPTNDTLNDSGAPMFPALPLLILNDGGAPLPPPPPPADDTQNGGSVSLPPPLPDTIQNNRGAPPPPPPPVNNAQSDALPPHLPQPPPPADNADNAQSDSGAPPAPSTSSTQGRQSALHGVRVSPPPPPPSPDRTTTTAAPAAAAPRAKPKGPGKPATASLTRITPRNISLAIYAADVGGNHTEYTSYWNALQTSSPTLWEAYDKYAKELKASNVAKLPALETIRAAVARLQGADPQAVAGRLGGGHA